MPLISLHQGDVSAVERALTVHQELLASLDSRILEKSSEVLQVSGSIPSLPPGALVIVRYVL